MHDGYICLLAAATGCTANTTTTKHALFTTAGHASATLIDPDRSRRSLHGQARQIIIIVVKIVKIYLIGM
jgi:hypothetical protein